MRVELGVFFILVRQTDLCSSWAMPLSAQQEARPDDFERSSSAASAAKWCPHPRSVCKVMAEANGSPDMAFHCPVMTLAKTDHESWGACLKQAAPDCRETCATMMQQLREPSCHNRVF
jgi:hypothetical protein